MNSLLHHQIMKVLICGSRKLKPSDELLSRLLSGIQISEVIEGGAKGVDRCAREYARKRGIKVLTRNANWTKYGRAAGPIRNAMMVDECDMGVVIWDGSSRGTLDSINKLKNSGKRVIIYEMK